MSDLMSRINSHVKKRKQEDQVNAERQIQTRDEAISRLKMRASNNAIKNEAQGTTPRSYTPQTPKPLVNPKMSQNEFNNFTRNMQLENLTRRMTQGLVDREIKKRNNALTRANLRTQNLRNTSINKDFTPVQTFKNEDANQRLNARRDYLSGKEYFLQDHPRSEWAKNEALNAVYGLEGELAKGVDFFLPDQITPKPVQSAMNYYKNLADEQQRKTEEARGGSWERELVGTVGGETIKNAPSAMLAYLTGGTSLGAEGAMMGGTLLEANGLTNVGNVVTRAINEVSKSYKNPMYWETFMRTVGTTYEKEKQNGADDLHAILSAMTNSFLNAQIEIGGGVEAYNPAEDFLQALYRSAKEEGLEEVEQYAVENLVNKAVGTDTAKWVSFKRGEDAFINPIDMAEQGFYGAMAGGLMSGGRIAIRDAGASAINALRENASAKRTADIQQELVQKGVNEEESAEMVKSIERVFTGTSSEADRQKIASSEGAMEFIDELFGGNAVTKDTPEMAKASVDEINDVYAKANNKGYRNFSTLSGYDPVSRKGLVSNRFNSELMEAMTPLRSPRGNVSTPSQNSLRNESVTPEQANLNAQTIGNLSEGFSKATRTVFEQMYDGKTEPTQYFEEMNNFRMQGRNGEDFAPRDNSVLTPSQQEASYNAGKAEVDNEVYLRNGDQRNVGTNSREQVRGMEEGAGSAETDRGVYQTRSSSGSEVQPSGKKIDKSRMSLKVDNDLYEPSTIREDMKVVEKAGKERGYKVNFFEGDYAKHDGAKERAWVDLAKKEIWIRSDDPDHNVEQIFGHEIFHTELENSEYKEALLTNIKSKVGLRDWNAVLSAYKSAYAGIDDMDYLEEELLCDMNGNLNGLRGLRGLERTSRLFSRVRREVKEEIEKTPKKNKAPPAEGTKASTALGIKGIKEKYKDQTKYLFLSEDAKFIHINNIVVKDGERNKGVGNKILADIIKYADETNKTITLTPTSEYGTQKKLKNWYRSKGFVENKGKNTDFTISDTMYRKPRMKFSTVLDQETMDKEYMDAVNRGDVKTAQEMVYAYAKRMGYDSPSLYHGTQDFGFTKTKTENLESKSDGGYYDWSPFFATDSLEVARTYSAKDDVKRLSEGREPFDEERFEDEFSDAVSSFVSAVNRFAGVYNYMDYTYNPLNDAFSELTNSARSAEDIIEEMREDVDNIVMDIIYAQAEEKANDNPDSGMDVQDYVDDLLLDTDVNSIWLELDIGSDLLREYDNAMYGEAYSGNYELLANTDNMLHVDAHGEKWNAIPYDKSGRDIKEDASVIVKSIETEWLHNDYKNWRRLNGIRITLSIQQKNEETGKWGNLTIIDEYKTDETDEAKAKKELNKKAIKTWTDLGLKESEYFNAVYSKPETVSGEINANFINEPLHFDKQGNRLKDNTEYYRTRQLADLARDEGYNGVIISNLFDDGGKGKGNRQWNPATIYIFFNPQSQVKSADPVVYDDKGDVIPLSERFNKANDDLRYSTVIDQEYAKAVEDGDIKKAKKLIAQVAKENGYKTKGYHGSLNASFTIFDKDKSHVGGNSGAGFYFSSRKKDAEINYANPKGADNQIKIDMLSDLIIDYGEWDGIDITSGEQAYKLAEKELIKKRGIYDVFLKFDNPYVRSYNQSTNIYDAIMSDFDESIVDRNDYDTDEDYEDGLMEYRDEHLWGAIDRAVLNAFRDMEDHYEILDVPFLPNIVSNIAESALDYGRIDWDDIYEAIDKAGEVIVTNDGWGYDPLATSEFTRAIIENFGYDAILDKEAGTKFNQLKGRGMTNTEHMIVFNPSQIKSADIVYDDEGNLIPLSERFSPKNKDIRFSSVTRREVEKFGNEVTDGGSVVKFSRVSWGDTDKEALAKRLIDQGFDEEIVYKWIDDVNSIVASVLPDFIADRSHSALKANSEYYFTLDLSTLCAKRRLYQGTYNAIMHKLKNAVLLPKDAIHLRALMAKMGYEVPCGICYEESRKKNEAKFANQWLNGYKTKTTEWAGYANMEHDDPYIPTLDDVLTTDGRANLRKNHPEALQAYLTFQKGRGSANPKVSLTHTDYRGEILNMTKTEVENVKKIGGLRVQSFSDFEINHVLDMMQAVLDMSAMKLTSQAYTKVPAFAKIFGRTGIKINLSLIGEVKEVDGKKVLVFDNKEGINAEEAFALRDEFSENVGTIIVGANPESVLMAWADPRIDMVIPFHRSGWSKSEFKALGLGSYKDFQEYQTERYILSKAEAEEMTKREKESDKKKPKTYKAGDTITLKQAKSMKFIDNADELYATDPNPEMQYWNPKLSGTENARLYLKKCAELHRRPVFYELLHNNGDGTWSLKEDGSTDGYWKSLVDFKMYDNDGNFAPQKEVEANFNMDSALELINAYAESGEDSDVLPVAQDVVDQFVKDYRGGRKYKMSEDEKVTGDDILKQAKKNIKASTALDDFLKENNLKQLPQPKFSTVPTEDNLGRKLTENQSKFFKDSLARDENGGLVTVYHTTDRGGFSIFDPAKSEDKRSFFFASNFHVSQTYASHGNQPISFDKGYQDVITRFLFDEGMAVVNSNVSVFANKDGNLNLADDLGNNTITQLRSLARMLDDESGDISNYEIYDPLGLGGFVKNSIRADEYFDALFNKFGGNSGYYECYLNFKNPLIVDGKGADWFSIPMEEGGRTIRDDATDWVNSISIKYKTKKDGTPTGATFVMKGEYKKGDQWLPIDVEEQISGSSQEDIESQIFSIWEDQYGFEGNILSDLISIMAEPNGDLDVDELDMYLENGWELDINDYEENVGSTRDISELAYNKGYDGVIIKNIDDRDNLTPIPRGESPMSDIYIAFSSEQIKLVNNENPTEDRDIRYSTVMQSVASLKRENAYLRDRIEYYKAQTKVTDRLTFKDSDIKKMSKDIVSGYSSTIKAKDIEARVKALGENILKNDDYDKSKAMAIDIARDVIENASVLVNDASYEQYQAIKDYFKGKTIHVPKGEIPDFGDFRKSVLKKMNLSTTSGEGIETMWEDLQKKFSVGMFPDDITDPVEMIYHTLDLIDGAEYVYENPYDYNLGEATEYCANDIMERLLNGSVRINPETYADRQEAIIKQTKKALAKVKAKRKEDIERYKKEQAERRKAMASRKAESAERTKLLKIARRISKIKTTGANKALINELIGDLDLVAKSITNSTVDDLRSLQAWYLDQKENNPNFISIDSIEKKLLRLTTKKIADMNIEDVRDLTEVLKNLEHQMRTQNRFIKSQLNKSVQLAGLETLSDVQNAKGLKVWMRKVDDIFVGETLSPMRYIRRLIGYKDSDPLYIATKELAEGEVKQLDYRMNSLAKFKPLLEDRKYIDSVNGKHAKEYKVLGFVDGKLQNVTLTKGIIMSLYLSSKNDDNMRHIEYGGVVIPDLKLYKQGKKTEAFSSKKSQMVSFNRSLINDMAQTLSEKDREFCRLVQDYYKNASTETNKVSEALNGFEIPMVDNYFPIHVSPDFTKAEMESVKRDGTIEGMGSHKERVKSSAPIYIDDIADTLVRSVEADAKYIGLAIPIRNFNKIFQVSKVSFEDAVVNDIGMDKALKLTAMGYDNSLRREIRTTWGDQAINYIEKFISDIQFPPKSQSIADNALRGATSKYAGAVLTTNASVALKQTASYPTAIAVLGWKPVLKAMGKVGSLNNYYGDKKGLEYVDSITPLLNYRTEGYNFREAGDIQANKRNGGLAKRFKFLNWIQAMDVMTTRKLWKATDIYVRDTLGLKRGDAGYEQAMKEMYNRVITETQPNYTMLERAGHLRSDSTLDRTLSMFKTQPYQNFNFMYDAIGNFIAKRNAWVNSKSPQAKADLKNARKNLCNALLAQIIQLAVFASMTSLWALFRGKDDKYRDEETGKITVASYLKKLGLDMLGSLSGQTFGGSELFDLIQSKITGEHYFGFTSVTDSQIKNMLNSIGDLATLVGNGLDLAKDQFRDEKQVDITEDILKQADKTFTEASKFAGVPYENIRNLTEAVYRWGAISAEGDKILGEYDALKMSFAKDSDKKKLLLEAYKTDESTYETLRKRMEDDGIKLDNFESDYINEYKKSHKSEDQQKKYDEGMKQIEASPVWEQASDKKKKEMTNLLNKVYSDVDDKTTQDFMKVINEGKKYGLTEEEYILYKVAKTLVEDGKADTSDEKDQALAMLKDLHLSAKEKELLKKH